MKTGGWALAGLVACVMLNGATARAEESPGGQAAPPPSAPPAVSTTAQPADSPPATAAPVAPAPAPTDPGPAPAPAAPPAPAAEPAPVVAPAPAAAAQPQPAPAPAAETPPAAPAAPAPAVAPPADPNAVPGSSASSSKSMDSTYLKLREIEERVNRLKEQVFQSKARLVQLQEVVLHGSIAGAKLVLVHRNEMGSSFKLSHVQYALDGTVIFNRIDAEAAELDKQEEVEVFNGPVAPGNHQLAVYLEYVGNGFGVFSYLEGYRFKIKSSYTLMADEGKVTTVRIVGYEKGGVTTELKDRPSVRFDVAAPADLGAVPPSGGAASAAPKVTTPASTP